MSSTAHTTSASSRAQLGCNVPHDHGKAVRYERLPAGAAVALAMPDRPDVVAERVPSDFLLRTRALDAPRRPVVHCPSFLNTGRCVRGADCEYAHLVPPTGACTRYDAATALYTATAAGACPMPWYVRSRDGGALPSALAAMGGEVAHAAAASAAAEALLRSERAPARSDGAGRRRCRRRGLNRATRWTATAAPSTGAVVHPEGHDGTFSWTASSTASTSASSKPWRHDPYNNSDVYRNDLADPSPPSSPEGSFSGIPRA